ncbi:chemotaxis protein CheB [Novosphingobium sp. 9]|uniref:chemotaxis protein CheB n=1 Tax=Novosphingobium sp. 9 TaxID=2025349 RepID=UPI0021B6683E|nr:chemotaxis protein CheB [Novosphingobium sp. 9]
MKCRRAQAVVIGASAGAIDALLRILPRLPADYPIPVLVVVHLPAGRRSELSAVFGARCALTVQEAEDKQSVSAGEVIFAPPNYHLLVEAGGNLSLSVDDPVFFSRPAIDVLFESAADAYGPGLVAVVLTGASRDGAAGLSAVARAGGETIVQDPDTASARTMPDAALGACPQARVLGIDEIALALLDVARA